MEIEFSGSKLERVCNDSRLLQKEYGHQAPVIMRRLAVLRAAPNLATVPVDKPERRHELVGNRKGTFAVDLKHPFRLIFEPAEDPVPRKDDGGIDLQRVDSIRILQIEDYH